MSLSFISACWAISFHALNEYEIRIVWEITNEVAKVVVIVRCCCRRQVWALIRWPSDPDASPWNSFERSISFFFFQNANANIQKKKMIIIKKKRNETKTTRKGSLERESSWVESSPMTTGLFSYKRLLYSSSFKRKEKKVLTVVSGVQQVERGTFIFILVFCFLFS